MQPIFSFQFILVGLVFCKCREDERSMQIFLNPLFLSVEEAKIILQLLVKEGCKCDSEIRIKDCTNMYLIYHSGRLLKEGWMAHWGSSFEWGPWTAAHVYSCCSPPSLL